MIPYSHPKQELLVNFVKTLQKNKVGVATIWFAEMQIWGDLPMLFPCLRDEWNYPTGEDIDPTGEEDIPSPGESSKWLNLNSFVARLKREDLIHGTIFAVSELREALEEKNTVREL